MLAARLPRKDLAPLVVIAVGLVLAAGVFLLVLSWQAGRSERELERGAVRIEERLRAELDRAEQPLLGLRGLYDASTHVDRDEFRAYVTAVRDPSRAIQALSWNPRVTEPERAAIEASAIADGVVGFAIRERTSDGELVPASGRDAYYPVLYIEPLEGNEAALGFDVGSESARRAALEAGRDSGSEAMALVQLVQERGTQTGMLVFLPVYADGTAPATVDARRLSLSGFVVAVYRAGDLVAPIVEFARGEGYALRITDVTGDTPISVDLGENGASVPPPAENEDPRARSITLAVADRTWTATLTRTTDPDGAIGTWLPILAAAASLLFAATIALYLRGVTGRAARIEAEVQDRTAELRRLADEHRGTAVSLSQRERRLQAILDTAADAIIGISERGQIESFNAAAEGMFGYGAEEVIGRSVEVLMPEATARGHQRSVDRYVETGEATTVVGQVRADVARRKDGSEFPIQLSVSEVVDAEGRSFTGIIRDMTEIHKAEERLREQAREARTLQAQAEQAAVAKSDFLARMSHEIRTPMNGVLGSVGLLLDTGLDEEQREYVDLAQGSGEALLAIINDILDFSKIEAGRIELDDTVFSLRDTVFGVAELLSVRDDAAAIDVLVDYADELPDLVRGDAGRVRQVLLNLGANAVKFTPRGHVLFRVQALDRDANDGWRWLRLSVSDTGIGIPDDGIASVFEDFTQVDSSISRKYGGTGLGLAISRQLVELMGGAIGVDSVVGEGSTFYCDIPLWQSGETPVPEPGEDLARARVLVVGERRESRQLLLNRIRSWGIDVSAASAAPGAVELLQAARREGRPFDVVICDCDRADSVRAQLMQSTAAVALADTKVIGIVAAGQRAAARADGAITAIVTRPWRPSRLMDALISAIGDRAPGSDPGLVVEPETKSSGERGTRVLLVDDNTVNVAIARRMLEKLSCLVDVASDGAEAVSMAARTPYDLVLMDCEMPVMDGYEAARLIRRGELNADVPIVALTADVDATDREASTAAGMDELLAKPVRAESLSKLLRRWVFEGEEARQAS